MARMAPRHAIGALLALALGTASGVALGGCGSGSTKTVSVSGPPTEAARTSASTAATTNATTGKTAGASSTATTAPPASEGGGTAAPSTTTRSAPAPAFTHTTGGSEALSQAVGVLQAHGYSPTETAQYHSGQTLRVLIGSRGASGEGHDQQAFFFVDERFIGTDAKEPSAHVQVVSQGDTEVTLAYSLYRPGDPLSSPGGGQATVRFVLDDGRLEAQRAIPPANSASAPSRR